MKKYVSPKVNVIKLGSTDIIAQSIYNDPTDHYQLPAMMGGWEEDEE